MVKFGSVLMKFMKETLIGSLLLEATVIGFTGRVKAAKKRSKHAE